MTLTPHRRYPGLTRRRLLATLAAIATWPTASLAQRHVPGIPQEFFDTTRPMQGDALRICVDTISPARDFDRAVAEAIAGVLLLKPQIGDAPSGFPLDGLGYFEEMQIAMNNDCDIVPGVAVQPGTPFPEWAAISRPYATIPFVLVAADPAFARLSDIPYDRRIGTAIGSLGDLVFLNFNLARPQPQRWRRLAYADPDKMLQRLRDGTLAAMLLWQPVLRRLVGDDLAASGLRVIPADNVPTMEVAVGTLVSVRDTYLRSAVDEAIGALIANGSIGTLLERFGYAGTPGP